MSLSQRLKLNAVAESLFLGANFDDCIGYSTRLQQLFSVKSSFPRLLIDSNKLCTEIMIQFRSQKPCFQTLRRIYYEYVKIAIKLHSWKPSSSSQLSSELTVVFNLCWLGMVLNLDSDEWERICLFTLRRSVEHGTNVGIGSVKSLPGMIYDALLKGFEPNPMFLMCCWCLIVSSSSEEMKDLSKYLTNLKVSNEVFCPLMGFVSYGNVRRLDPSYLSDLFSYSKALKSCLSGEVVVNRNELLAIENDNIKPFSTYLDVCLSKDLTDFDLKWIHEGSTLLRSEFLNAIGRIFASEGKRQMALQFFKDAIRECSQEGGTVLILFNAFVQFKQLGLRHAELSAIELILQKVDEEINNFNPRPIRSVTVFRKDPELNKVVLNAVGCRLFSLGSYSESANAFMRLKSLYPHRSEPKEVFQSLFYSLVVSGRNAEATQMMNRLDDSDPVSTFLKGVLLLRSNQFLAALPVFQCVVDEVTNKDDQNVVSDQDQLGSLSYSNIGLINIALGKLQESIRYLETGHRICPGNSDILYNYCLALIMIGDKRKAYELWNLNYSSCTMSYDVNETDKKKLDSIAKRI